MKDCTTVVTFLLYLLVLALCVTLSAAQAPSQFYSDNSGTLLAFEPLGGPSQCAKSYMILRDNITHCLAMVTPATDSPMEVKEYGCDSSIRGATAISCASASATDFCFILNPTTNELIQFYQDKGNYSRFSLPGVVSPTVITAKYDPTYDMFAVIVVDGSNNAVYLLEANYPFFDSSTTFVPVPLTDAPTGTLTSAVLLSTENGYPFDFFLVSDGDTTITMYNTDLDAPVGTLGTFGHIKAISMDAYNHVYVIDSACNCIKAINEDGSPYRQIDNIIHPTKQVALSRTKVLVVDDTNTVWKYEQEHILSATISVLRDIVCTNQPGRLSLTVDGQGDFPFVVYVFPDGIATSFGAPNTSNISVSVNPPQPYNITIVDDILDRNFRLDGMPLGARGFFNNTVVPGGAQAGNFSYGWRFNQTAGAITVVAAGGMQAAQFEYFEFYINVGNGGQHFRANFNPSIDFIEIRPGQIPNGTWKKFRMNFPFNLYRRGGGSTTSFQGVQFTDLLKQNDQNYIYIDSVKLITYANPFPMRTAYVFDACGVSLPPIAVPFKYNPFKVEVIGTPVSCNVNTTTATDLAFNGILTANITNGVAPFSYNWTYRTDNQRVLSGFPILNSYITVYDNALNKSWVDISIGDSYNLNDTTYYRSYPSSISFTVTNEGQGLIFQTSPEIDSLEFSTIEFWANGGPIGGQSFSIYLLRSTSGSLIQTQSVAVASGLISIPANQWVKVSYTLPVLTGITKYNLVEIVATTTTASLSPTPPITQPTVYIDDIILIAKPILTVTDATGCKASTPFARIVTPPAITQTITVVNAKCFNKTDGMVQVTMTGGQEPFDFSWEGSANSGSTFSGLGEGFFNVNATDHNQCTFKPATATVLQPPPITVDIEVIQPKCFGGNGIAKASASGGAGQFTYAWLSASAIAQTLPTPAPEPIFLDALTVPLHTEYASVVCRGTGSHLGLTVYPTHSGYCTLSINLTPTISTAALRGCTTCFTREKYSSVGFWIFGDTVAALETFSVTLTKGSLKSNYSLPISSLASLSAQTWTQVIFNLSSFPDMPVIDGIAFVSSNTTAVVSGGSVLLDDIVTFPNDANGAGFSALTGFVSTMEVTAANYIITIVDGNGCLSRTDITVPEPSQINITYFASSPTFQDGNDGSIDVQVSGGTPPYSYHWLEINLTTEDVTNVVYGAYVLRVTDAHGCIAELNAYIDPYIPVIQVTVRKYNANLSSGLAALVSVGFIICLFSGTMLFRYWASFSVLGSFLSSMILVGSVLSFLSALVLLPEPTDALCQSFIWFLGVGFALVYGCLFIKTWALYKVWRNAVHYHKAALTPLYIVKCLGLVVTVEVVFLAIWTALDPPKVHLVKSLNNTLERQCNTNNMTFWIIFLVGKGSWLIFGAVLSVLTKNIAKEYNESASIAYAIYNNVLLGAIAIPLAILLKEVPGGRLTVEVVIITIAFSFTLVVIFFKIWHNIILPDKIPMGREMRKNRNTASSTGSIKSNSGERQSKGSPTLSASASVSTVNLREAEHSEA